MDIERNLTLLRVQFRNSIQKITSFVKLNYLYLNTHTKDKDICMFCGSYKNLSNEHVLPKWIFEGDPEKTFITSVNNTKQTYNKTTINACKDCNSSMLSSIERCIKGLFINYKDSNKNLKIEELVIIIRWMELIGYKFQIIDLKRRFTKYNGSEFIPYLKDIPIAMLPTDESPAKIISKFRNSIKKMYTKDKSLYLNSLVIFKSKNPGFHLFHRTNEFLFLELPKFNIALFYFFNKEFSTNKEAHNKALDIIQSQYK